ncbi:MAG: transcription termination factor NusA, partial [Gammaproteobacteria bacterium]|nr:transcription termination factor NusA [Gammaproteobacteria bacterium]
MLSAAVKRMERGSAVLDLGGNVEALLRREDMLPSEHVRIGDRLRVLLDSVNPEPRGPQLLVTRTAPQLVIELFRREVPEVADGLIDVVAAARDPGLRAKIAVRALDKRIDPIGACVGMHGTRVQSVSNELGGERVDITLWDETPAQFVINALSPASIASIYVDEENNSMDVAVEEEQLSLAIGRGGQNVRLAAQLTGWQLNILSEQEAEEKAEREVTELIESLMEQLEVDADVATALIEAGFSSIEEVAYVPMAELLEIESIEQEELEALRGRAQDIAITLEISREEKLDKSKPAADLLAMEQVDERLGLLLAEHEIVTKEDLAEQSVDDLMDVEGMTEEFAGSLIMAARADWFTEEEG